MSDHSTSLLWFLPHPFRIVIFGSSDMSTLLSLLMSVAQEWTWTSAPMFLQNGFGTDDGKVK